MKIICFDLDGTLVDVNHRLHYIKNKPKNWVAFEKSIISDTPIKSIIDLNNILYEHSDCLYIITGRNENQRDLTIEQLDNFKIKYDILMMRKKNDYRKDYFVKLDYLNELIKKDHKPDLWFEDRTQVVDVLREAGVQVLQTVKGDY